MDKAEAAFDNAWIGPRISHQGSMRGFEPPVATTFGGKDKR
jgi:hypothetical protein